MYNKVGDKRMDRAQFMKGTLEGCILKVISLKETYGYEIVNRLQHYGFGEVKEGTIYPILVRLEKKNLIGSSFKESPYGPKRKYYTLTDQGHQALADFIQVWQEVKKSVDTIIQEV